MYAGHLDLTRPLLWTVDDALGADECARYVERFHEGEAEIAPIVGERGVEVVPEVRNNTRVMWDDAAEAEVLLGRVRGAVPASFRDDPLVGANPRLRLYRYGPGEKHGAHWDSEVELDGLRSRLTLVFYLNDDFGGGATDFPELARTVRPRRGSALLFQHRVLHVATPVTRGAKYVLRTDLFYRAGGPPEGR